jgi:hypothetical protein
MSTKLDSLHWCTNCVSMSTRPRIGFDKRGWCNAHAKLNVRRMENKQ